MSTQLDDRTSNKGQSRQEVQKARGNETVTKNRTSLIGALRWSRRNTDETKKLTFDTIYGIIVMLGGKRNSPVTMRSLLPHGYGKCDEETLRSYITRSRG